MGGVTTDPVRSFVDGPHISRPVVADLTSDLASSVLEAKPLPPAPSSSILAMKEVMVSDIMDKEVDEERTPPPRCHSNGTATESSSVHHDHQAGSHNEVEGSDDDGSDREGQHRVLSQDNGAAQLPPWSETSSSIKNFTAEPVEPAAVTAPSEEKAEDGACSEHSADDDNEVDSEELLSQAAAVEERSGGGECDKNDDVDSADGDDNDEDDATQEPDDDDDATAAATNVVVDVDTADQNVTEDEEPEEDMEQDPFADETTGAAPTAEEDKEGNDAEGGPAVQNQSELNCEEDDPAAVSSKPLPVGSMFRDETDLNHDEEKEEQCGDEEQEEEEEHEGEEEHDGEEEEEDAEVEQKKAQVAKEEDDEEEEEREHEEEKEGGHKEEDNDDGKEEGVKTGVDMDEEEEEDDEDDDGETIGRLTHTVAC